MTIARWLVDNADDLDAANALTTKITDVVVLNVGLSDEEGLTFCQHVRNREGTGRLPVIHNSATCGHDVGDLNEVKAWADGYLCHPIQPRVLEHFPSW